MRTHRGNIQSNILFLKKTKLINQEKRILEIGSGSGHLIKILKDKNFNISGCEINENYIKYAKNNYDISLIRIKRDKLPFDHSSFDIIISFDVFEHIYDINKHLREVKRVLKKNGYYLVGTPNKWTNIPYEMLKTKSFTKYKTYHCSLHSYWELKRRFINNGFKITFVNISVVNDFFKLKIRKVFGKLGLNLLDIINLDRFPIFLKTNFYIVAKPLM